MCRSAKQVGLDAPLLLDLKEDQLDPAVLAALPPGMQREIKLAFMAGAKPVAAQQAVCRGHPLSQLLHQPQQCASHLLPYQQPYNEEDQPDIPGGISAHKGGVSNMINSPDEPGLSRPHDSAWQQKAVDVVSSQPAKMCLTGPAVLKGKRKQVKQSTATTGISRFLKQPKLQSEKALPGT